MTWELQLKCQKSKEDMKSENRTKRPDREQKKDAREKEKEHAWRYSTEKIEARMKAKERRKTREESERGRERPRVKNTREHGKQQRTAGTREDIRRKPNHKERGEKRKKSKGGKARTQRNNRKRTERPPQNGQTRELKEETSLQRRRQQWNHLVWIKQNQTRQHHLIFNIFQHFFSPATGIAIPSCRPFQQPTRHPEMKLGDVTLEGRCSFHTGYTACHKIITRPVI